MGLLREEGLCSWYGVSFLMRLKCVYVSIPAKETRTGLIGGSVISANKMQN